jgi:chemotaxis protein methyltransferase CheR
MDLFVRFTIEKKKDMSPSVQDITDEDIKVFLEAFKTHSNYDFANYSLKSLKRRIAKILADNKLSFIQMEKEILSNPQFMEEVARSITVNTTELFRDPGIWVSLRDEILPKFAQNQKINIWHAGCSTGQEVYSMMIILNELGLLYKSEIYASDINSDVLELAKTGRYKYRFNHTYIENFDAVMNGSKDPSSKEKHISFNKYFTIDKVNDSIQMKAILTGKPVYKKIDLVKDENLFYIKFDLIICRNVIIYFNYELQNKVLNLFYQNLHNDGCLLLGFHESILGPYTEQFDKKNQAYFKKNLY